MSAIIERQTRLGSITVSVEREDDRAVCVVRANGQRVYGGPQLPTPLGRSVRGGGERYTHRVGLVSVTTREAEALQRAIEELQESPAEVVRLGIRYETLKARFEAALQRNQWSEIELLSHEVEAARVALGATEPARELSPRGRAAAR